VLFSSVFGSFFPIYLLPEWMNRNAGTFLALKDELSCCCKDHRLIILAGTFEGIIVPSGAWLVSTRTKAEDHQDSQ